MLKEHKEFYEMFEKRHEDPLTIDIKKALHWFLDYMGEEEWRKRRSKVIQYFRNTNRAIYGQSEKIDKGFDRGRMAFHEDWIAWYLYLAESLVDRPAVDEPFQSARIWPVLATIGQYVDELKKIEGIKFKLHDLLKKKVNQPDSNLFEFLVAICYIRNNWTVEFIPETSGRKTPD